MLELKNIMKKYVIGENTTMALNGVSASFGEKEFVAILGTSGSGKTTMLNVIGGLDKYDSGDLVINGVSTKEYKSRAWDTYRNHSIGFVFQSYNLIPHQTVLANVELALTLSGVSRSERKKRAVAALEKVGLGDQIKKKPNQMSGGQMQRVAIARALINDPDIVLADEPTGALDTETSRQIMELLSEISRDKLVVMVTHNPELADTYATRILRLSDGKIISDTPNKPSVSSCETEEKKEKTHTNKGRKKRTSMSVFTAFSLSLRNLMTKKARTFLTSFAGSIGIIGIAAILALSNGINLYIEGVQKDTLASYPITIEGETLDMQSLVTGLVDMGEGSGSQRDDNKIYGSFELSKMYDSVTDMQTKENNLKDLKVYIEEHSDELDEHISAITYGYDLNVYVYGFDPDGKLIQINPSTIMSTMYSSMGVDMEMEAGSFGDMYMEMYNIAVWTELMPGKNGETVNPIITDQYDVIAGEWPTEYDEAVLIVNESNEISDIYLSALGILTEDEILDASKGEGKEVSFSYDDFIGREFYAVLPTAKYSDSDGDGVWTDMSENEEYMKIAAQSGEKIKISGIIRPNENASGTPLQAAVGYTSKLTEYFIEKTNESEIVQAQKENPKLDIFSGLKFDDGTYTEPTDAQKAAEVTEYVSGLDNNQKSTLFIEYKASISDELLKQYTDQQMSQFENRAQMEESIVSSYVANSGMDEETIRSYLSQMTDDELYASVEKSVEEMVRINYKEQISAQLKAEASVEAHGAMLEAELSGMSEAEKADFYDDFLPATLSESTYEQNIEKLQAVDVEEPSKINIYAISFEAKDEIAAFIDKYNDGVAEDDKIEYTDYVAILMSSVTTIINAISTVLVAFVSISLVVSSIMIGIITYISVLERTKEIGILRAIGASKKDISRVFNAETFIIGLFSGVLGIAVTELLCIPANILIEKLTDIPNVAKLPLEGSVALVIISVVLTLIGGLIPSKLAAKKDPVVALRSE